MKFFVRAFLLGACGVVSAFGQTPTMPYKNPTLPTEVRVKDLLGRMTPEEKFRQVFSVYHFGGFDSAAFQAGICGIKWNLPWDHQHFPSYSQKQVDSLLKSHLAEVNAIQKFFVEKTRLGIPALFIGESLHGCEADISTSFPQSIALAASFNPTMIGKVAAATAIETQQHGFHQVLSPVINLGNDVRWGRVEETYGEDPFLNSILGVAFVREFEKRNLVTTPKHFIANVGDGGRDSYPIHLDERTLNNYYYPPFKACIQEGGSRSIMSAYNSVNGKASGMNPELLQQK
jgi:beta-glucosidase